MGGTIAPQASPPAATAHESIDLGDVSPWWTARRQAAGAHPRPAALPDATAVLGAAVICAVLAQRLVAPPRLPPETIVLYAIALICLVQGARAMRPALEAAWPGCMPIRLSGPRWREQPGSRPCTACCRLPAEQRQQSFGRNGSPLAGRRLAALPRAVGGHTTRPIPYPVARHSAGAPCPTL
jgi:hypothetical protein